MGNILLKIFRVSGGETEEDEELHRLYYNQGYYHPSNGAGSSCTFWGRLREIMLGFRKAMYNAVKAVLQKLRRVRFWFRRLRKPAAQDNAVLPLRNPAAAPSVTSDHSNTLLKHPLLNCSASCSSLDYNDKQLQSHTSSNDDSVGFPSSQQWPEGIINYSDNMQQTDDHDKQLQSDTSSDDDSVGFPSSQQWPEGIINYLDNMQQTDDHDKQLESDTSSDDDSVDFPSSQQYPEGIINYLDNMQQTDDHDKQLQSDTSSDDDSVDFPSSQQYPEGIMNYSDNMQQADDQDHRVLVFIPEYTPYSDPPTGGKNVVDQKDKEQAEEEEEEEEEKEIIYQVTKEIVHQLAKIKSSVVDESELKGNKQRLVQQQHKTIKKTWVVVNEGRWIKHYSSRHRILLVGDGDFSFSACLALAFGCASNMIATSLDSKEFLKKSYQKALSNINELKSRECKVLHGIDATKMANHELLRHLTFDRIIFNFPFAGFFKDLSRQAELRRHRRLVSLFLKNAKEMISENGEIHISHKTNGFHSEWMLESMASSHKLRLIEAVNFNLCDYPGYNTKYGFGTDNNFNCYPSKTYKFGVKMVRY